MGQTFKDRLKLLIGGEKPYSWARKAGIEKGLFQYYWQKDKIPTFPNLLKIQRHTGCSLDWLLTGQMVNFGLVEDLPFIKEPKPANDKLNTRRVQAFNAVQEIFQSRKMADIKLLELFLEKLAESSPKTEARHNP